PHPVVASTARELLNKSDNERSGVLSTAMSFLGLYRDPVVAQVTRRCDWRIADLIADPRPATLYLVVPPSDISRTKPPIRLALTPGEVMQLPPADEIVMVAGTPPIRAKKARYYEDARFKERVLPPPDPQKCGRTSPADGWSALAPQKPDPGLLVGMETAESDQA